AQGALVDVGLAVGELDVDVGAGARGRRPGQRVPRHHRADEVAVLPALGLRRVEEAGVGRVERVEVVVELARGRLGRDVGGRRGYVRRGGVGRADRDLGERLVAGLDV